MRNISGRQLLPLLLLLPLGCDLPASRDASSGDNGRHASALYSVGPLAGGVASLAAARNSFVVSAKDAPAVFVFDAANGRQSRRLTPPEAGLKGLAIDGQATYVAGTLHEGKKILAWRLGDGALALDVEHTPPVKALAVLPKHGWLALADELGAVSLLELSTGREVRTLPTAALLAPFQKKDEKLEVTDLAASPDETRLALVAGGGLIADVELDVDKPIRAGLFEHAGFQHADYSPDGRTLVAGGVGQVSLSFSSEGAKLDKLTGSLVLWDLAKDEKEVISTDNLAVDHPMWTADGASVVTWITTTPFDDGLTRRLALLPVSGLRARHFDSSQQSIEVGHGPLFAEAAFATGAGVGVLELGNSLYAYRPLGLAPAPAPAAAIAPSLPDAGPSRGPAGQLPLGSNPVRIVNPNDFTVDVELSSEGASRKLTVAPHGDAQALVADGRFEVFFVYSSEPDARYAGDPFSLDHQGIEIQIIKSTAGNYGIHRVR